MTTSPDTLTGAEFPPHPQTLLSGAPGGRQCTSFQHLVELASGVPHDLGQLAHQLIGVLSPWIVSPGVV
jgi:hypothetical protein